MFIGFMGTYTPKLDEKGRFFLPSKFRDEFAGGLVMTRAQDRAIAVYTPESFVAMTQQAINAPETVMRVRDYQRMVAAGASNEVPDKQGRVTIPPMLRAYAGLDKDIVVIGAMNRVEIWDPKAWEAYSTEKEKMFAEMNEEIFPVL